ncbi:MAG: PAS domain S-box protein [Planctomycetes bacterium]|nr:PAS domain S-box protein [Planctomycetota bacterium]
MTDAAGDLVDLVSRHRAELRAALDAEDDVDAARVLSQLLAETERHAEPASVLPTEAAVRDTTRARFVASLHALRRPTERSLASLRVALANLPVGVILSDVDFGTLEWNEAALRLHGFVDIDEARRRERSIPTEFALIDESGRSLPFQEWPPNRLRRGERVENWIATLHHKATGRERIVRHDGAIVADPATGERLILLFLQDLTDEREVRRERDATANLLRAISASTSDAIFAKDREGRYTFVNAAAARFLGREPSAILGVDDRALLDEASAEVIHAHDRFVRESGESSTREERLLIAGVPHMFLATKSPLRDREGRVVGIVGISRDVTERVAAEDRLRASHLLLRTLIDHAEAVIWIKDLAGRFRTVNRRCVQLLGHDEAAIVGRSVSELFGSAEADQYAANDRLVIESGVAQSFEETVKIGGVVRTFLSIKFPLRDDAGRIESLGAICTEITERIESERKLRESEELYHRLVDVLPNAVFLNRGGRIAVCNRAFVELCAAPTPDDVIGLPVLELFPPEYHAVIKARIAAMMESGRSVEPREYHLRRRDGRLVPVSIVATPVVERSGTTILVVVHDLTERERSLELLRAVMGSVTDSIIAIDTAGTIRTVNPSVERMFGYSPAELIGADARTLMPDALSGRNAEFLALLQDEHSQEFLAKSHDVRVRRRDGSEFDAELFVTSFSWNGLRHFTGVVRDVTQRKQLENELLHAQRMEAVGRLAGGVAHDFNNLLTVILGYCELIDPSGPAADVERSRTVIRNACERARRLTAQLLAFSRKAIVAPRIVDLNEVVRDSEQLLRRLIGEDIDVQVELAPNACVIRADVGQLEQVLLNLAVNARDAMPRGGTLRMLTRHRDVLANDAGNDSAVAPGRHVELEVTDTGCGIEPDALPRVFEPFFTTKNVGEGTGLGLSVVQGAIEQAGGHVRVQSSVGVGTTFFLLFPAVEGTSEKSSEPAPKAASTGTESILLVEDEPDVRRVVVRALTDRGYTVTDVGTPRAALELMESRSIAIDLLVTDVVMPGMDGPELAEALRRRLPALRVIFVSGYTDDTVLRRGVDTASVRFLHKPFTREALARKVREALDGG